MRSVRTGVITGLACLGFGVLPASAVDLAIEGGPDFGGTPTFKWNEPLMPGSTIWFDIVVSDDMGLDSQGAQITASVIAAGSGVLTFDDNASADVELEASYWIVGNSAGANALDKGADVYQFGDSPDNGTAESLGIGDFLARFAFTWDGVIDDYEVTIDTSITETVLLDDLFSNVEPNFDESPVMLHVPEPAALSLLAIGGCVIIGRRRRR